MDVIKYLEESIKIELNTAKLYFVFSDYFKEDYDFWWTIANEELNHAALLKATIKFAEINDLPEGMILDNIGEMIDLNKKIDEVIETFKSNPSRQASFEIALNIETSAGESHYQELMSKHTDNEIIKLFQYLNREDINHYDRIKGYYSKHIL